MSKMGIVILLLVFVPVLAQVKKQSVKIEADTGKVFREMKAISRVKAAAVDSIISLQHRLGIYSSDTVMKSYNVDYATGKRVIWNFIYTTKNRDTIFQTVSKTFTNWK